MSSFFGKVIKCNNLCETKTNFWNVYFLANLDKAKSDCKEIKKIKWIEKHIITKGAVHK